MQYAAFRLVSGAAVLMLTAGLGLAAEPPTTNVSAGSAAGKCPEAQAQAGNGRTWNASITARHTNVHRVRYTAAHALPAGWMTVASPPPQAQAGNSRIWNASITARHTNVHRVRYTAAHALPAGWMDVANPAVPCPTRAVNTPATAFD